MKYVAMIGFVASLLAGAAQAQSVKLTGDEIRALLTGNTAIGRWEGAKYRQFFGSDGVTIYAQEGARSTRGEWRVDDAAQEYQSIWPRDADWEGWFVMEYGGTYYWVSRKTPPTPFQVLEGEQLVADGTAAPKAQECATLENVVAGTELPKDAMCSTSRVLGGGASTDCHWSFEFRSDAARTYFANLVGLLKTCADGDVTVEGGTVNHPDSYDQVTAQMSGLDVSLSLKDKGALAQTLVFLRVARPAD